MIELVIDSKDMDNALQKLDGNKSKLLRMMKDVVPAVARRVRQDVIGYLDETVALAPTRGALVKRAVKAVRNYNGESRFNIVSKRLLLDDYDIDPRVVTAQKGVPVKRRKSFSYHLRKHGELFNSLSALTGKLGDGSIPFIAMTHSGKLRVMYRSANVAEHDTPLLVYAPTVQYHAATPEMEERAHTLSAQIFREELFRRLEDDA
jgi:hypothetical protein